MKKTSLFVIAFLISLATYSQNLVAWYTFDNMSNGTLLDRTGHGLNGVVTNATLVPGQAGLPNSAFHFNGNRGSCVTVAASNLLNLQQYTIIAKVKINNFNQNAAGCFVNNIIQRGSHLTGDCYGIEVNPNNIGGGCGPYNANAEQMGGNGPGGYTAPIVPAGAVIPQVPTIGQNQWHCFAVSFDNNNVLSVYVDGVFFYQQVYATGYNYTGAPKLNIGTGSANTNWLDGDIDDIQIYDMAIRPADIEGACSGGPIGVNQYTASEGITMNGNDIQLGNACGRTASPFTVNREINQNGRNLNFYTKDTGKIFMGGYSCPNLKTRLEISSYGLLPTPTPANSYSLNSPSLSGLRFTNLTAQTTAVPNQKTGVLSLDDEGDVIWVQNKNTSLANNGLSVDPATGFIQLGQPCGSGGNSTSLTVDREVPLNDFNFVFSDGQLLPGKNRISIGSSCTPNAKFEVIRNKENTVYDFTNRTIAGINLDETPGTASGVYGEASNMNNPENIGGDFLGQNGHNVTYGVRGIAQSKGGLQAFGGWFSACGASPNGNPKSPSNVGIYAEVCTGGNNNNGPDYAGYFNGDVFSTTMYIGSDKRLKKNIESIPNALDLLNKIQPKKYEFTNAQFKNMELPKAKENYGVIAQELEQVLPGLVKETPVPDGNKGFTGETFKAVNYAELIPILIQAVKDQQTQIEELKKKVETLNAATGNGKPTADASSTLNKLDIVLSNFDAVFLGQNYPNPFNKLSAIPYFIPSGVSNAQIRFTSVDGKNIKSVNVTSRGKGVFNIYASDLTPGLYTYTLVIDGNTVDSKKMEVIK